MKIVSVLRFDKEDIEGVSHIAEVIDVHYSISDGNVDIIIGKERLYTDYKTELDALGTLAFKTQLK